MSLHADYVHAPPGLWSQGYACQSCQPAGPRKTVKGGVLCVCRRLTRASCSMTMSLAPRASASSLANARAWCCARILRAEVTACRGECALSPGFRLGSSYSSSMDWTPPCCTNMRPASTLPSRDSMTLAVFRTMSPRCSGASGTWLPGAVTPVQTSASATEDWIAFVQRQSGPPVGHQIYSKVVCSKAEIMSTRDCQVSNAHE